MIYTLARMPILIFHTYMKQTISSITSLFCIFIFISCNSSKKITTIDFHDGSYAGEVDSKGLKHGKGQYSWLDGSLYEGDFEKDLRHGTGTFKWPNGESYKGDYFQDQRTGQGIYSWPDGATYSGSFLNGKRHGTGTFTSASGAKYQGDWFDDLRHGNGILIDPNGGIIRGVWQNGKLLTTPMALPKPTTKPDLSLEAASMQNNPLITAKIAQNNGVIEVVSNESLENPKNPGNMSVQSAYDPGGNLDKASTLEPKENIESSPTKDTAVETEYAKKIVPEEKPLEKQASPSTGSNEEDTWSGSVNEVEGRFVTKLIDGIDTIFDRKNDMSYTGKMRILDDAGNITGELHLVDGRMNGEELYYEKGKVTERNLWQNGKFLKSLDIN